MGLAEDFKTAAENSKTMTRRPSNEELLDLYGLFKQASEGDNAEARPGGFDFKAIAKHDAWESRKGISQETAMEEYVKLVNRLLATFK